MNLLVGDRVYVHIATAHTSPGPATLVGVDLDSPRPFRVTLDNEEDPFDVMDVSRGEITRLAHREPQAPMEENR
jgi:hypothetical protein